MYLTNFRLVFA